MGDLAALGLAAGIYLATVGALPDNRDAQLVGAVVAVGVGAVGHVVGSAAGAAAAAALTE